MTPIKSSATGCNGFFASGQTSVSLESLQGPAVFVRGVFGTQVCDKGFTAVAALRNRVHNFYLFLVICK